MKNDYRVKEVLCGELLDNYKAFGIKTNTGYIENPRRLTRYALLEKQETSKFDVLLKKFMSDKRLKPKLIWFKKLKGWDMNKALDELVEDRLNATHEYLDVLINNEPTQDHLVVWIYEKGRRQSHDSFDFKKINGLWQPVFMDINAYNYHLYEFEGLNPKISEGNALKFFVSAQS